MYWINIILSLSLIIVGIAFWAYGAFAFALGCFAAAAVSSVGVRCCVLENRIKKLEEKIVDKKKF